jgi:hypothetical protein
MPDIDEARVEPREYLLDLGSIDIAYGIRLLAALLLQFDETAVLKQSDRDFFGTYVHHKFTRHGLMVD